MLSTIIHRHLIWSTQLWNISFFFHLNFMAFVISAQFPEGMLGSVSFDRFLSKTKQTPVKDWKILERLNTCFQQTEWMRKGREKNIKSSIKILENFGKTQSFVTRVPKSELRSNSPTNEWNVWMSCDLRIKLIDKFDRDKLMFKKDWVTVYSWDVTHTTSTVRRVSNKLFPTHI